MQTPLSWLKDFIDIDLSIDDLAYRLTMAGLEVEAVHVVGLPMPESDKLAYKLSGLAWESDKIVVGAIHEVMPHPNADRLVLCKLDDGKHEHIALTGAPNLFYYKGKGTLDHPLKVAYAREGATIVDAYTPGHKTTKLKRRKIRGVESYSMACSERELGISDEHEGIIILDDDAPVGVPLVDYMGDAVFDIALTPNVARDANILGVAREIAALTNKELRYPSLDMLAEGPSIEEKVAIEITDPERNPRFVLGLIENIEIKPSPYEVQRRLRLAGMRPINNIVDATNYVMLEVGQPLHAFDYDILKARVGDGAPTIITRTAKKGEQLKTLDNVERELDDFTVLVRDQTGLLALAGVMGGADSEVSENTQNVLLEGAAWNMINTRRTIIAQQLSSEAAYRFSRGVHPAMADRGVRRGLELMRQWSGGTISQGLMDNYPLPPDDPTVRITPTDVRRWLGIELNPDEITDILRRLEFTVEVDGETIRATAPDHRLDINEGVIGMADLTEEIARIYGYDNIPETRMSDDLPPQLGNPELELEERVRDLLVDFGLQEVITYRMTTPKREARRLSPETPPDDKPYLTITNPISSDRTVMRHSLLASVIETIERNAHIRERLAIFEIGEVFLASKWGGLPDELPRLIIALTGPRSLPAWQDADTIPMDFYDLKGIVDNLLNGLHLYIEDVGYEPGSHPSFHPGKCANVLLGERQLGVLGEVHPRVADKYDLPKTPLLMAEIDVQILIAAVPDRFESMPVPAYPPMLEDIALVVDEALPAADIVHLILQTGGKTITDAQLFDVYRGDQIGPSKKSLAYHLTYQASDRTLTDTEVAKIRQRIVRRMEREVGARLRS